MGLHSAVPDFNEAAGAGVKYPIVWRPEASIPCQIGLNP